MSFCIPTTTSGSFTPLPKVSFSSPSSHLADIHPELETAGPTARFAELLVESVGKHATFPSPQTRLQRGREILARVGTPELLHQRFAGVFAKPNVILAYPENFTELSTVADKLQRLFTNGSPHCVFHPC